MQNFDEFVKQGPAVMDHLSHLEDLVLEPRGGRIAIDLLTDLGNLLEGEAATNLTLSTKWDGAPAVLFGPDPADGRFFVSTKAALSKTRKLAKSHAEIDALFNANVASILHACFDELGRLQPTTVMQGDFLFTYLTLQTGSFEGRAVSLSFQPNTIRYTVPYHSNVGERVRTAAMGIVVHTKYDANWVASPATSEDLKSLQNTGRVFLVDPSYRYDYSASAFSAEEAFDFHSHVETAIMADMDSDPDFINEVCQEKTKRYVVLYINACVRTGEIPSTVGFIDWTVDRAKVEAETRSSVEGKLKVLQRFVDLRERVAADRAKWNRLFRLHTAVQNAKNLVIRKLAAKPSEIDAYIGVSLTGPEGFVVTKPSGAAVKLVERSTFSRANLTRGNFVR